jgi:spermidine synthase
MSTGRKSIPFIFYLLTGLIGIVLSLGLFIWFRQYTLFFGMHTVSWATIAIALLTCMALGCIYTGKIADSVNNRLTFFASLTALAGIFLLCDPLLFAVMTRLYYGINNTFYIGTFGTEILRFFLSFLFLLIPVGLLAGVFILLIRYFIRHTGQSGVFMSAALVSGSAGAMISLLSATLYLVPHSGFRGSQVLAAVICLFTALLSLLYHFIRHAKTPAERMSHSAQMVRRTAMRFRKSKIVLETGAKLTRAMIRVYNFQGFASTAYLLLCLRILVFHNTLRPVYFHSLAVVVVLAGLALGGTLYKRTVEKPVNSFLTLATLQIITGLLAIFSYAALYLTHQLAFHEAGKFDTFTGLLAKQLGLYATLAFLPAFTTGISLPLAGKLYPRRLEKTGNRFGRLGYIWFLSALFGIALTLFVLIPFASLYYSFFALVLAIILSGVYLILRDSRLIRGFRLGYALLSVLLYIILVAAFKPFHFNILQSDRLAATQPVRLIEGSSTSLSTVKQTDGSLSVLLDNHFLFSSDQAGRNTQEMPAFLPILLNAHLQSALVMGFGMGTTASVLEKKGLQAIHIAEIFPEIVRFSADVFAEDNDDILTSSRITLSIEDPRVYLIRTRQKVDLITTGCSQLDQLPNAYTTGYYRICFAKLSENGLMCQVIPINGLTSLEFRALIKSFTVVFPDVSLWYLAPDRALLVGSRTTQRYDLCQLDENFATLTGKEDLALTDIHDLESLLGHLLLNDRKIRQYVEGVPENTDNRPWIQFSRTISQQTDRALLEFLSASSVDYEDFMQVNGTCNSEGDVRIRKIKRFNAALRRRLVLFSGSPQ